jgi:hypothetical protein
VLVSASGANNSNFFGSQAGNSATNAYSSNFLGQNAGSNATAINAQISLVKMLVIVQQCK